MSKLAKKPIIIPDNVNVSLKDSLIEISGPLGKLSMKINPEINIKIDGKNIFVEGVNKDRKVKMLEGLTWSKIRNMVLGVTTGFTKELEIRGVGYQAQVNNKKLILKLRFTHPVEYPIPEGISITTDQKGLIITVKGIDKELVGEVAAQIRAIYPAEHYKGTGIRYLGEQVIKKAGKTVVGVGGTAGAKK